MKLFKYKQFNESNEDIHSICKKYGIKNYAINDGLVDVNGDVVLRSKLNDSSYQKLTKLPLKFGKVTGSFFCQNNKLISLDGSPYEVEGFFNCSGNELTSLEGGPQKLVGDYDCSYNKLTSLKGIKKIDGELWCHNNKLTSLEFSPDSLSYLDFHNNNVVDVKFFPKISGIDDVFRRIIRANIFTDINSIEFDCGGNPVYQIFRLFPEDKWLEVIEFLNEYDVIRDGNKVVLQALELVYDELGLEVPENIEIEGYEII